VPQVPQWHDATDSCYWINLLIGFYILVLFLSELSHSLHVAQTKLASSLVNFWVHDNILIDVIIIITINISLQTNRTTMHYNVSWWDKRKIKHYIKPYFHI